MQRKKSIMITADPKPKTAVTEQLPTIVKIHKNGSIRSIRSANPEDFMKKKKGFFRRKFGLLFRFKKYVGGKISKRFSSDNNKGT